MPAGAGRVLTDSMRPFRSTTVASGVTCPSRTSSTLACTSATGAAAAPAGGADWAAVVPAAARAAAATSVITRKAVRTIRFLLP